MAQTNGPNEMLNPATPTPTGDDTLLFQAVLEPNRSGDGLFGRVLVLFLGAALLPLSVGFYFIGAWPIVGVMALAAVGLLFATLLHHRRSRGFEVVAVTPEAVTVERYDHAGRRQSWSFQPHWLQVRMDDPPQRDSYLTIRSHGKVLEIGRFLTPEERLSLAKALRRAIAGLGGRPMCRPEPI